MSANPLVRLAVLHYAVRQVAKFLQQLWMQAQCGNIGQADLLGLFLLEDVMQRLQTGLGNGLGTNNAEYFA